MYRVLKRERRGCVWSRRRLKNFKVWLLQALQPVGKYRQAKSFYTAKNTSKSNKSLYSSILYSAHCCL